MSNMFRYLKDMNIIFFSVLVSSIMSGTSVVYWVRYSNQAEWIAECRVNNSWRVFKSFAKFTEITCKFWENQETIGKMDDPILVEGSADNEEAIAEAVSNFEIMTAFISRVFSLFFAVFFTTNYFYLVCILVVLKTLSSIFCQ